jgi:hypothetical protein
VRLRIGRRASGPVAITVNRHKDGGDISDQSARNPHSGNSAKLHFSFLKSTRVLVRHPTQYEVTAEYSAITSGLGSRNIHAISGEQAATAAATANPIPLLRVQKD